MARKFIQIEIKGSFKIFFQKFGQEFHGNILADVLESYGISFNLDIYGFPNKKGVGYELIGAGWADFDNEKKSIKLYSKSVHYNIGPDFSRKWIIDGKFLDWKVDPATH